jgi:hypothetical protein
MPQPNVNPDGTVQVSAPTQSAFGPASASAPPPPAQAPQVSSAPAPGLADALLAVIHHLIGVAPPARQISHRPGEIDAAVDKAAGGLGDSFDAGGK